MKIYYEDEYTVNIYTANSDAVPRVGECVMFVNEDWRVKSVTWMVEEDAVVVVLSQTMIGITEQNDLTETVQSLKKTVAGIMQNRDSSEKKVRQLKEQVSTLKTGINQRIYNESKK